MLSRLRDPIAFLRKIHMNLSAIAQRTDSSLFWAKMYKGSSDVGIVSSEIGFSISSFFTEKIHFLFFILKEKLYHRGDNKNDIFDSRLCNQDIC